MALRAGHPESEVDEPPHPFFLAVTVAVAVAVPLGSRLAHLIKGHPQVPLREDLRGDLPFPVKALERDRGGAPGPHQGRLQPEILQDAGELGERVEVIAECTREERVHLRRHALSGIETEGGLRVLLPAEIARLLHPLPLLGHREAKAGRHRPHVGRSAPLLVVVVNLPAVLADPDGDHMIVFPLDVEVAVHQVRLPPVTEVLHQPRDEREDLILRAGVLLRGVHRGMEAALPRRIAVPVLITGEDCIDALLRDIVHIGVSHQFGHSAEHLPLVVVKGRLNG